ADARRPADRERETNYVRCPGRAWEPMGDIEALLTHEPGNPAECQQGDADHDQRRARYLQQEWPVGLEVGADQAERRAQGDEGRRESCDEERRLAQHLELLPNRGL